MTNVFRIFVVATRSCPPTRPAFGARCGDCFASLPSKGALALIRWTRLGCRRPVSRISGAPLLCGRTGTRPDDGKESRVAMCHALPPVTTWYL